MAKTSKELVYEPCALPEHYLASDESAFLRDQFNETLTVDAVVIGAGITGSSLAIHLAQAGKTVVQLEAAKPGWGGSGRAFGLVVPYAKHGETKILSHFGKSSGERLIKDLATGPQLVRSLLEKFNIVAEYGSGWLMAAHSDAARSALQARAHFWRGNSDQVELLNAEQTQYYSGSDYYDTALLDRRALSINPLAYTQGLFCAAQQLGVKQFNQSTVSNIEKAGLAEWRVSTANGTAIAENVFICTNAYTDALWPDLAKSYIPVRGFQATTDSIDESILQTILPLNNVLTDTRHLWSGIRKVGNGQLQLSVGGPALGANGCADLVTASERLRSVYPQIKDFAWKSEWSGWVAVTLDQFPKILKLDQGVWSAIGYSGRGLGIATLLGRELCNCIERHNEREPMFCVEELQRIPFHQLAPVSAAAMIRWYAISDRWADFRRNKT